MKLWLLRAREDLPEREKKGDSEKAVNPWEPWYDKAFGFVVRAESADQARRIVTDARGDYPEDEGPGYEVDDYSGDPDAWLSPEFSTCVELPADGEPGIIIRDHHAA